MAQNKRRSSKGRKPNHSKEFREEGVNTKFPGSSIPKSEDKRSFNKAENDPAWYGVSGQLVKDSANIPFNNPIGYPLDMGESTYLVDGAADNLRIPGIMALKLLCGPGASYDNTSPVNLAAKNIYTFVRHVNSGAANYEPADLMLYILAINSAYQLYAHLVRAYGICRTFKQNNRYYPDALLMSMGFNPKIKYDLPALRTAINVFVRQIGSRPVPANLNILKRQTWVFSNIFKDAESNKAQLYLYVPHGFYFYDEYMHGDDKAGRLKFVQWDWCPSEAGESTGARQMWDVDDIKAICDTMANRILESEDLGIISGDIVKAYGQNVYQLAEINEDFSIEPVHSMEVLTQIHNCEPIGDVLLDSIHVVQDVEQLEEGYGALLWEPASYEYILDVEGNGAKWAWTQLNHIIDMPYTDPSPDDVMVATRLKGILNPYTTGPKRFVPGSSDAQFYCPVDGGTEFVTTISIWAVTSNNSGFQKIELTPTNAAVGNTNTTSFANMTRAMLCEVSAFDWHPYWHIWRYAPDGVQKFMSHDMVGDVDNITTVGNTTLKRMNQAAILSLWDVPETAFYKG